MKLSDIKPGDTVIADDVFDCMDAGTKIVHIDGDLSLFVECSKGNRYLDGQASDGGELIGISPGEPS